MIKKNLIKKIIFVLAINAPLYGMEQNENPESKSIFGGIYNFFRSWMGESQQEEVREIESEDLPSIKPDERLRRITVDELDKLIKAIKKDDKTGY